MAPAGWQTFTDATGVCQGAAPPDWEVTADSGAATAPNTEGNVTLIPDPGLLGWDQYKAGLKATNPPDETIEDSDTRLLYSYDVGDAGINYLSARNDPDQICAANIIVTTEALEPVARQIADTIGPSE